MKKWFVLALGILLLCALLSGCECKHENWTSADCDSPKTCESCGVTEGAALGHDWIDADCDSPQTCRRCNATGDAALGHVYSDSAPDCENPKTCSVCGQPEGEAKPHTWADATCTAPKTCSICGMTQGDPKAHTWADATCTAPKTCADCGATEGEPIEHSWSAADCSSARTCSVCGATDGAPLGHSWMAATCENPKTCENCGATDGEAKGHTWEAATCILPKKCSTCHATDGNALGHDWTKATSDAPKTCKRCGTTDGDKLNVDSRFNTEACQFLFGKWVEEASEEIPVGNSSLTLEIYGYYEFYEDGTCDLTMVAKDEEAFRKAFIDVTTAETYAILKEQGISKAQADAMFKAEYGMTISEFYAVTCDAMLEEMFGVAMPMVYYVEGDTIYLSDSWKNEFSGSTYEIVGDEIHLVGEDGLEFTLSPVK